jgi:hypothetical protein
MIVKAETSSWTSKQSGRYCYCCSGLFGLEGTALTQAPGKAHVSESNPSNGIRICFYGVQWKISAGRILKSWKFSFTELNVDLR